MNTLQSFNLIIDHVTKTNNLAAKLRDDKITKTDAMKEFKKLLDQANEKIR